MAKLTRLQAGATTLTEARSKVQAQLPPGAAVVVERISGAKTVEATGESEDFAHREAEAQVPQGAEIIARQLLVSPAARTVKASAFRSAAALAIFQATLRADEMVRDVQTLSKPRAGGRVGGGICDNCNGTLSPGATYLRPGGHLCCEACTDTFLCTYVDWTEAARNLNSAVGPGVPADIQGLAMEVWN